MKILTSISEIQNIPDFYQGENPVACTAPFMTSEKVLIGLYGTGLGHACIEVSLQEFEDLKSFLYEPQAFRLAVHGIKRIWRNLNLGSLETNTHLVMDTELMGYLLNSGASKDDYTLSHLVHEYLHEDYPLWLQGIADRPYPQVMHEILAWDAYLIYQLAYFAVSGHVRIEFQSPILQILRGHDCCGHWSSSDKSLPDSVTKPREIFPK